MVVPDCGDWFTVALRPYTLIESNIMNKTTSTFLIIGLIVTSSAAYPGQHGSAKPEMIAKSDLAGMPTAARQEIRVLTATLEPGQRSVFHTHRSPVTTFVLDGALTLEVEGKSAVVYKAGKVVFEEPGVPTTAYNASASDTAKVLIFYLSDLDTPFLDPISQ